VVMARRQGRHGVAAGDQNGLKALRSRQ
jgi:hypothetical protein